MAHEALIIKKGLVAVKTYDFCSEDKYVFKKKRWSANKFRYKYLGRGIAYKIDGVSQILPVQKIEHFWQLKPLHA